MCKKTILLLLLAVIITNSEVIPNQDYNSCHDECFTNPPYPDGPWQREKYSTITLNKNVLCVTFGTFFGSTPMQCIKFNCKNKICHNGNIGYGASIFIC